MSSLSIDLNKRYTLADYLTWMDDVRRELIDGIVSLMAGASYEHADISWNIASSLKTLVNNKGGDCKVYCAPVDVCLPENGETADDKIYTVVQPDIFVVCDLAKLYNNRCYGAPDMIVEIISPSNRKKDMYWKYSIYEKVGVREYWIVNPKTKSVIVHVLQDNGEYDDGTDYISGEKAPVHIFDGLHVDVEEVFKF